MISYILSDAAANIRDYFAEMPEVYVEVKSEIEDLLKQMDTLRMKLDGSLASLTVTSPESIHKD
jgi:hypothetical protein